MNVNLAGMIAQSWNQKMTHKSVLVNEAKRIAYAGSCISIPPTAFSECTKDCLWLTRAYIYFFLLYPATHANFFCIGCYYLEVVLLLEHILLAALLMFSH